MSFLNKLAFWRKKATVSVPRTKEYSPNPINVWGIAPRDLPPFTFIIIRAMLWDPVVRLGLAMRSAPIANLEFAYKKNTNYVNGIQAKNPEVAAWVLKQLRHIWIHELNNILKDQLWGWSGGEVMWRLGKDGQVHVDRILTRHASDIRALELNGRLWGVRFRRVPQWSNGHVDLSFPKSFWHAFFPEDGSNYGVSILRGAYSPWSDKWLDGGALDVRRLFMHKDAYGGVTISYPPGTMEPPPGTDPTESGEIPNGDIARQMAEQLRAGGVVSKPSQYDASGNELWKVERATIPASPGHILQYPQDLDIEIMRGLEIPDDVLTSGATGAWAGKAVPQQAFYVGLDRWANSLLAAIKTQILEPGVVMNFGKAEEFEVEHKPLALQASEQQAPPPTPPGQGATFDQGQVIDAGAPQQMSQRVAEALVGEGILGASQLVEATRSAMHRRLQHQGTNGRTKATS